MDLTNLGYNKQNKNENVDSWGDFVNANTDLLNAIQNTFIESSAKNRFILHVLPTDATGNYKIEDSLKSDQLAVGTDDLNLNTILQTAIGTNEETFPVVSDTKYNTVFASIELAINHVTTRRADEGSALGPWVIALAPGEHVVDSDIVIPDNTTVTGIGNSTLKLNDSSITINSANAKIHNCLFDSEDIASMLLLQSQALFVGLLISKCDINVPVVIDSYNQADGIQGHIANNIFRKIIKFACTGGSSFVDDELYIENNEIIRGNFEIGDTANATSETALTCLTPNGVTVAIQLSDIESRLYDTQEAIAVAADLAAIQAAMVTLQTNYISGRVMLAGTTGLTALATSPKLKGNMYI